jgi:septum site-determining protein MinD
MALKGRNWQSRALQELMNCKKSLFLGGFDVVIMDSSPGVDHSSVNVVACSDYVISVFKSGEYRGVQSLIEGIYSLLDKQCGVIENMCVNGANKPSIGDQIPLLAVIPCMCDVSKNATSQIFTLENPSHPFSRAIFSVKEAIP